MKIKIVQIAKSYKLRMKTLSKIMTSIISEKYYIRFNYFEKIRFRLIGSFAIINDNFNRENGNSRVWGPGTLRTGNNRGRWKSTHRRGGGSSLPGSSLEETKERSRFNASNVGRDKLSKHFSRYYQALCTDLPHVLRRVSAGAFSNPLPLSSDFLIFLILLVLCVLF